MEQVKYDPGWGDLVIGEGELGKFSIAEYAAFLEISKETFQQWLTKYPYFRSCYELALTKAEAFFSEQARSAASEGNQPAIRLILETQFQWKDKKTADPDEGKIPLSDKLRAIVKKAEGKTA